MSWQKRLRDITAAGGLTVCATHGFGASCGFPPCNANPDPCCSCYQGDTGGYGGAGCIKEASFLVSTEDGGTMPAGCSAELACAAHPTAACCESPDSDNWLAASSACTDAGFGYGQTGGGSGSGGSGGSGGTDGGGSGGSGTGGAGEGGAADAGGE